MSDYVPLELLSNILGRLSVADVLRCTSVCKSWYDLITSSFFISLHLKLSTPNHESRLLVKWFTGEKSDDLKDQFKVYRDNQTFDEISELECPFASEYPRGKLRLIGYINGLLCLRDTSYTSCKRIFLWNPSLRKSLMLPEPRFSVMNDSARFGFGFLPETNDYKIVRLMLLGRKNDFNFVDTYELSTNSWRICSSGRMKYVPMNDDQGVFLNGTLNWGVRIHDNDSGKIGRSIVSFELKNENLGALSIPNCLDNDASYFEVSAVKESLCLIHRTVTHYEIWVLKEYGVPDSWTIQLRINKERIPASRFHYFRENGKILDFLIDKTICKAVQRDMVSYDYARNQAMKLGVCDEIRVTPYVESLALIKYFKG